MTPRFAKYASLARVRPELPAWLDAVTAKSVSVNPAHRYGDVIEFAHELEQGAKLTISTNVRTTSFYDRDPLRYWKFLSLILAIIVLVLVARNNLN